VKLSALKLADDGSGDLVVRLWEATGTRVATTLSVPGGIGGVRTCNLLEEPRPAPAGAAGPEPALLEDGATLELGPFEVVTLRIVRP